MSESQRNLLNHLERSSNIQDQVLNIVNQGTKDSEKKINQSDYQVQQVLGKLSTKVKSQYFPPDHVLANLDHKESSNSKTKDAIAKDKALYRSLMFLRKLDQDLKESQSRTDPGMIGELTKGTIIWNAKQKQMYDQIESNIVEGKAASFVKKKVAGGVPVVKTNIPRKPRPMDIINERMQMGKYGPQPYHKEDLRAQLKHEDFLRSSLQSQINKIGSSKIRTPITPQDAQNEDLKIGMGGSGSMNTRNKIPLSFELNTEQHQMFVQTERAKQDSQDTSDNAGVQSDRNQVAISEDKPDEYVKLKQDLVQMDKISDEIGFSQQFHPQIGINQLTEAMGTLEIANEERFLVQTGGSQVNDMREQLTRQSYISKQSKLSQEHDPNFDKIYQAKPDIMKSYGTGSQPSNQVKYLLSPKKDSATLRSSSSKRSTWSKPKVSRDSRNDIKQIISPIQLSIRDQRELTGIGVVGQKIQASSLSPRHQLKTKERLNPKGSQAKSQISLNTGDKSSPDNLYKASVSKNSRDLLIDKPIPSIHGNFLKPVIKQKSGKKLLQVPSIGSQDNRSVSAVTKVVNDTSIVMSDKNQTMYLLGSGSNTFLNSANRKKVHKNDEKIDNRTVSNDSATVIPPSREYSQENIKKIEASDARSRQRATLVNKGKEEYQTLMIKEDSQIPSAPSGIEYPRSPQYLETKHRQSPQKQEEAQGEQIANQDNQQVGHSLHILQVPEGQQYLIAQDAFGNPQLIGIENGLQLDQNGQPLQQNILVLQGAAIQDLNNQNIKEQSATFEQTKENSKTVEEKSKEVKSEKKTRPKDYMQLLQGEVNLNELNDQTRAYLMSDSQTLYSKKDIPFIKKTLLQLGGQQAGLMSITSKNPTRKQYQSNMRIHQEAKKINIDFNYKPRSTSGYLTHTQNSRHAHLMNTAQSKGESDIKHIMDFYDKKSSRQSKRPPNLLKQKISNREEVETALHKKEQNTGSPLVDKAMTNTSVSPTNFELVSKGPQLQQQLADQPKQELHVIAQESKSSTDHDKSNQNTDSQLKPPQLTQKTQIRKHITMQPDISNIDMKQTLNQDESNQEILIGDSSKPPMQKSGDQENKKRLRGLSAKFREPKITKQIVKYEKTSEIESQGSQDQIQDLDKLSKRSSITKQRLYSSSKIANNLDLPANMIRLDTSDDDRRKDNSKFSPRNANKKGQKFINELLKQRQDRHKKHNVPQMQNLVIPMKNYDENVKIIQESNTLREYDPGEIVGAQGYMGMPSTISASYSKLEKNNIGEGLQNKTKQQVVVSKRNIQGDLRGISNQVSSKGFPLRGIGSAKYQNTINRNQNFKSLNKTGLQVHGLRRIEMSNNVVSATDSNQVDSPIRIDQQEGFVSNRDYYTQRQLFGSQGNTVGLFGSSQRQSQNGIETDRALKQKEGLIWDGVTQSSMPLSQELQLMHMENIQMAKQINMAAQQSDIEHNKYGSYEKQRLKISRMSSAWKFKNTNRLLSARDQPQRFQKNQNDVSVSHDLKIQSARVSAPSDQFNSNQNIRELQSNRPLVSNQQSKKVLSLRAGKNVKSIVQSNRLANFLEKNRIPVNFKNQECQMSPNSTLKMQTSPMLTYSNSGAGMQNFMQIQSGMLTSEVIIDELSSQIYQEPSDHVTTQSKPALISKNQGTSVEGRIETEYERETNPTKLKILQNNQNKFNNINLQDQQISQTPNHMYFEKERLDQIIDSKFISELFDPSQVVMPYMTYTGNQFAQQEYKNNENLVSSLMKFNADMPLSDSQKNYEQMILERDSEFKMNNLVDKYNSDKMSQNNQQLVINQYEQEQTASQFGVDSKICNINLEVKQTQKFQEKSDGPIGTSTLGDLNNSYNVAASQEFKESKEKVIFSKVNSDQISIH